MSASPPIAVKHWHRSETLLSANTRPEQVQQTTRLFDNLVGGREQRRRHGEAKYPGGLSVNNQLKLRSLHDWQFCRIRALEDATAIDADLTKRVRNAGPVAHQPANFSNFARRICSGDPMMCRQCGKLDTSAGE